MVPVAGAWAVGTGGNEGPLGTLAAQPRQLAAACGLGWSRRGGLCRGRCSGGSRSARTLAAAIADAVAIEAWTVGRRQHYVLTRIQSRLAAGAASAATAARHFGIFLDAKLRHKGAAVQAAAQLPQAAVGAPCSVSVGKGALHAAAWLVDNRDSNRQGSVQIQMLGDDGLELVDVESSLGEDGDCSRGGGQGNAVSVSEFIGQVRAGAGQGQAGGRQEAGR